MAKSFNTASVRVLGAIMMFLGLTLCVLHMAMMDFMVTILALAMLVLGFYLFVGGIRLLAGRKNTRANTSADTGHGVLFLTLGLVLVAAGVLALLYKGTITTYIIVVAGAIIAVYGVVMLICLAIARRSAKKVVFDVIMSVLTIVVGVLIALLVLPAVGNAVNHLCYYLFGGLAIAVGAVELVAY